MDALIGGTVVGTSVAHLGYPADAVTPYLALSVLRSPGRQFENPQAGALPWGPAMSSSNRGRRAVALIGAAALIVTLAASEATNAQVSVPAGSTQTPPSLGDRSAGFSGGSCRASWSIADPAIDALQELVQTTLDANRRDFPGVMGRVHGFGAGEAYPQVWLRDSATLLPFTVFNDDASYNSSWLIEHLAHPRPDGSLNDWIGDGSPDSFVAAAPNAVAATRPGDGSSTSALSMDRNTSAVDQDASAILAAGLVADGRGYSWLTNDVHGRSVIDRLDIALTSAYTSHLDSSTGLLASAFTADWGDVAANEPTQQAIYQGPDTPKVVGLYVNVMAYASAKRLSAMLRTLGLNSRAEVWAARAQSLQVSLRAQLWDSRTGRYRIHRLLPGPQPSVRFDDSATFAFGGNALAAQYGLMTTAEVRRFFDSVEAAHASVGATVLGVSLIPPYPSGFFAHPAVREYGVYQNGGQWDWFAGRLVLAMFERGDSQRAFLALRALAARDQQLGGLFEWQSVAGAGRGSANYAGSAGALGAAVLRGLWGLQSDQSSGVLALSIAPRFGWRDASLAACVLDRTKQLVVEQRVDQATVGLSISSPAPVNVRWLLPDGCFAAKARLGTKPVAVHTESVGRDHYVVFDAPVVNGTLSFALSPVGRCGPDGSDR